ncbi:YjzD family protein [Heyndrickxia ginsengihumi]|uniref:YjzD family protein n=1 Tax=Heyndrickxia ginsengihumi TaxID=363870 RepID=A0A0A6VEA9_9BACI|nr:YjzD family protein [Heyndrickxia ginsengihumi]KHD85916.1 hypothetical protein NG54_06625 [Heyndrickxia ginsengihumi]MBE6184010.1 DUF2929 family protein [Bacillus sp. (in: firmicutes)]MCM3023574.1 YjzD family protein [Heyndrickxia ginsengihumi]NEY18840.1 YjzD family protein [Heyndrickxia ginsengihumi]
MKYILTLFWTFLLVEMLGYVGSAMTNSKYDVTTMAILSIFVTIFILIVNACLSNKTAANE